MSIYEYYPVVMNIEVSAEVDEDYISSDLPDAKARKLLSLCLSYLLLGEPRTKWFEKLKSVLDSIDVHHHSIDFSRLVEIIVAGELLGVDQKSNIKLAWSIYQAALEDGVNNHVNLELKLHIVALALACLDNKNSDIIREWNICTWFDPEYCHPYLTLETLFLSQQIILNKSESVKILDDAVYSLHNAALAGYGHMVGVTACLVMIAKSQKKDISSLVYNSIHHYEQDLFPNGADKPARVVVENPVWKIIRPSKSHSNIEIRLKLTGSGGMISSLGPVLESLIYELPRELSELLKQEMPVAKIKKARKRAEINSILADSNAKLIGVIELNGDIDISEDDFINYKNRFEIVIEWMKARCFNFRMQSEFNIERVE